MLSYDEIKALPLLDTPVPVRIKFRKVGSLQYISHLDLQRTFMRCLTRAAIPVWYTKGFNPHAKLVFSLPLSIGCESECEYVDIKIDRDMPLNDLLDNLRAEFTDEMKILDVYSPKEKFSEIAYARYKCTIRSDKLTEVSAEAVEEMLTTSPLNMMKHTKSGEKEIDIVPLIKSVSCKSENDALILDLVLCAGSEKNLNPELPVRAVCERFGLIGDISSYSYRLLRKDVLKEDLTVFC